MIPLVYHIPEHFSEILEVFISLKEKINTRYIYECDYENHVR